jgi:O-antigen ligase
LKRIGFSPLVLIIPWTLVCLIGSVLLNGLDLEAPALVVGAAIALTPLMIYLALKRPLGFPFAIYAVLSEFDHLFPPGPLGTVAKFGGILVIAMLLIKALWIKRMVKPGREAFVWFIFFVWVGASMAWTEDPGRGMLQMQQYIGLFVLYVLLSIAVADITDMRLAIFSVIGAAIAAAAIDLSTYGSNVASKTALIRATLSNTRSNFVDPNHLAASLQMPIALLLIMMLRERNPIIKGCYLLGCAVLGGGMLVTGSRAGLVSVGVVFLFLFVRSNHRLQLAIIGIGGALLSLAIPTVWTRFGDETTGELGGRLPIWHVGFAAFKDHWLIGHGAGSFLASYEQALRKAFEPPSFFYNSIESHDIFLYAAVEFGVIGVALLAAAWWFQFRALKDIPPGDPFYDLRTAIEAGTLALLVEACTLDLLTFKYIWIAFGLTEIVRGVRLRLATPDSARYSALSEVRTIQAGR